MKRGKEEMEKYIQKIERCGIPIIGEYEHQVWQGLRTELPSGQWKMPRFFKTGPNSETVGVIISTHAPYSPGMESVPDAGIQSILLTGEMLLQKNCVVALLQYDCRALTDGLLPTEQAREVVSQIGLVIGKNFSLAPADEKALRRNLEAIKRLDGKPTRAMLECARTIMEARQQKEIKVGGSDWRDLDERKRLSREMLITARS